jgi:hypothetical protein
LKKLATLSVLFLSFYVTAMESLPTRSLGSKLYFSYFCQDQNQKAQLRFYGKYVDWESEGRHGIHPKSSNTSLCIEKALIGKVMVYSVSNVSEISTLLLVDKEAKEGAGTITVRQIQEKGNLCTKEFEFKCQIKPTSVAPPKNASKSPEN